MLVPTALYLTTRTLSPNRERYLMNVLSNLAFVLIKRQRRVYAWRAEQHGPLRLSHLVSADFSNQLPNMLFNTARRS
jgi:hypothetical protein